MTKQELKELMDDAWYRDNSVREVVEIAEQYAIHKQITLLNNIAGECKFSHRDYDNNSIYTTTSEELREIITDLQQQLQKLKYGK